MTVGIGGAGIAGLAIEVLPPPVQNAGTSSGSGGTLVDGTYRYYITAINANGETTVSNQQQITASGGNTSINTVNWSAVSNATGYKIYRTASGGAAGTQLLLDSVGLVTTYDDDGSETPSGAFPTVNTAYARGTYTAPTKFFPFLSESLTTPQATIWRRPIRQSVDIIGAVAGNFNVEGDINMEALEDVVLYFLASSRTNFTQVVSGGNFLYTFTPTSAATAVITLSLTVVRNGVVFGYNGCAVSSFSFGISDGLLTFNVGIVGSDESTQALPTPTWPTTEPFGAGSYDIEIPTGTAVLDTDTFEWTIEDNGEPQFRLKSSGRGSEFIKYGERNATMTLERDFETKTDYAAYKALTEQSITLKATKGSDNYIELEAPTAIKDSYEVGLSGQGDLVRASIAYQNIIDATGKSWEIRIHSDEDMGYS